MYGVSVFSIHFILPFLIAGVTLTHLALLHKDGSNNPIGSDEVPFYPYFVSKDMFAFFRSVFIFHDVTFISCLVHLDVTYFYGLAALFYVFYETLLSVPDSLTLGPSFDEDTLALIFKMIREILNIFF